jgi:hypothetical protein
MFITISDISKGKPFRFETPIDNSSNENKKIGIRSITMWVGWYNINEEQTCRWGVIGREESTKIKIKPGYYLFEQLVEQLTDVCVGLSIEVNLLDGIIDMVIPPGKQLLLSSQVSYLLGMNEEGWLKGDYFGDRTIQFAPQRMLIYLNQLSTTDNISDNGAALRPSRLLETFPIPYKSIGGYQTFNFDNPHFKFLQTGSIHELEFEIQMAWGNEVIHKLDNHSQPISILLEVRDK